MDRRHTKESTVAIRAAQAPLIPAAPPPPPWDTPPYNGVPAAGKKTRRRSTYGLQRDYRVMGREQRVTKVLNSGDFRNELESILKTQLEGNKVPKRLRNANQWQQDSNTSRSRRAEGSMHGTANVVTGGEAVIPINDLRGVDSAKYTIAEGALRCKLAAVYRLIDLFGWSKLIYNHITVCAPGKPGTFFVNAFGLMYREITASNLIRVDLDGNIVDPGSTQFGINTAGFALHSAIHESRSDVKCVIHLHTNAGVAVSSMNCGLLPISTEAASLGEVSYHDYREISLEEEERERELIAKDLGPKNKVLILHNHGVVAMGNSVEEAFHIAHSLVKACEIQVAVMSAGMNNILQAPQGVWFSPGMGVACKGVGTTLRNGKGTEWKSGELEFEALMRMLDSKGYNTGYNYKGLELLEPREEPPSIVSSIKKRQIDDQWDFLDEKKIARKEPVIKQKTGKTAGEETKGESKKLWEFLDEGHGRKDTITGSALNGHIPEDNEYQLTGSDDEGEEKPLPDRHSNLRTKMSPIPPSDLELTAKRVARSTGKAVEKLALQTSQLTSRPDTADINGVDRTHHFDPSHDTTQFTSSSIHQPATINPPQDLSPIQLANYTAKKVSESTENAVKKLATSQGLSTDSPKQSRCSLIGALSQNDNTLTALKTPHEKKTLVSSGTKHHSAKRRHKTDPVRNAAAAVSNRRRYQHKESETSDFTDSDQDYSTTESPAHNSRSVSPVQYGLLDLNSFHTPADITFLDGYSSLDKVTYTAEIVAGSTGEAVQKLSETLTER